MKSHSKRKRVKRIIGYNCKVCRGKNFREDGDVITHICSGWAEPVLGTFPTK